MTFTLSAHQYQLIDSDFKDSYCIYRGYELVLRQTWTEHRVVKLWFLRWVSNNFTVEKLLSHHCWNQWRNDGLALKEHLRFNMFYLFCGANTLNHILHVLLYLFCWANTLDHVLHDMFCFTYYAGQLILVSKYLRPSFTWYFALLILLANLF